MPRDVQPPMRQGALKGLQARDVRLAVAGLAVIMILMGVVGALASAVPG